MSVPVLSRMRPWLGTFVEVRLEGPRAARASDAVERAYAEIAGVHRLMSFHESGSDLDRLHRARVGARVRVDARTIEVIAWALRIAQASAGCFDPTVAATQVAAGRLPRPASRWTPDPAATWCDIELCEGGRVRLLRPLWIDLGGIAKGYAVDRAVEVLVESGASQACVNAGGDLRVAGTRAEAVHLRCDDGVTAVAPVRVENAAFATSAGGGDAAVLPAPLDGRTRRATLRRHGVSVAASRCVVADALTKVALAADVALTRRVLERFEAQAWLRRGGDVAALGAAA